MFLAPATGTGRERARSLFSFPFLFLSYTCHIWFHTALPWASWIKKKKQRNGGPIANFRPVCLQSSAPQQGDVQRHLNHKCSEITFSSNPASRHNTPLYTRPLERETSQKSRQANLSVSRIWFRLDIQVPQRNLRSKAVISRNSKCVGEDGIGYWRQGHTLLFTSDASREKTYMLVLTAQHSTAQVNENEDGPRGLA